MPEQTAAKRGTDRGANLVVVRGHLDRPVDERVLGSGVRVAGVEVRVPGPPGTSGTIPVVWPDAPTTIHDLVEGDEVLVLGRVRRRFFRAGGAVQSRTEVVADSVVSVRRAAKVRAALVEAAARLAELS